MVIFRLTQDEYESLKSACALAKGRSISDYMRSELLTLVQSDPLGAVVQRRFSEIDRKLADLHELMKHVFARLDVETPPAAEDGDGSGPGRQAASNPDSKSSPRLPTEAGRLVPGGSAR